MNFSRVLSKEPNSYSQFLYIVSICKITNKSFSPHKKMNFKAPTGSENMDIFGNPSSSMKLHFNNNLITEKLKTHFIKLCSLPQPCCREELHLLCDGSTWGQWEIHVWKSFTGFRNRETSAHPESQLSWQRKQSRPTTNFMVNHLLWYGLLLKFFYSITFVSGYDSFHSEGLFLSGWC